MSLRLTEKDRKVLEAFTAKNGVSNIPMAGIWLEEDEIDLDDDEYYDTVEYYEKEDGSSAEVYYSDYGRKEVSDIRFWMTVDDKEKEKFMAAFKELNPDWKPDEDSILYDEDAPYKGFLYQKALGRF